MKNFKVIDISWPVNVNVVEYKDKGVINFKSVKNILANGLNETNITMNAHTGTHIDSQSHFIPDGKTINQISMDHLLGPCKIFDLSYVNEKIVVSDLKDFNIVKDDTILFKTKNSFSPSEGEFNFDFVYIDKTVAQYLVSKRVKTVGIDYLGIEREQPNHETHRILLESNVTIIEGLRLKNVKGGMYFLVCLPIKFEGIEASPARAILLDFK